MRAIGGLLLGIAILAAMFSAVGLQAQSAQDAAVANGTNASAAAYNGTNAIFELGGTALSWMVAFGGLTLVSLLAIGMVMVYSSRGR